MEISYFPLQGGEDLLVPRLSADPGRAIFTRNYELDRYGRYRRYDGYERFDGRPKPSEASYWVLNFDAGSGEISVGDVVAGATSSASGEALVVEVESGSWGGADAAGYIILFNVTGDYQDDENLQVSAVTKAVANGADTERGADNDDDDATWIQAAIEATRDDIQAVTGSGNILGVWQYGGVKYAFRNNSGGTAAVMFKSSTSGWTECDLGATIAFTSGGTYEVQEDDTITGATSGATATVKRIILTSGTWAGGDAAGTFVLYSQSGTFQSENLNVGATSNVATIAGDSTDTTLNPSGRFEFVNYNFGGHASTRRMYGCDGANKAFEWDGSVFVPITTGMTTDTPEHIAAHKGHLFLSFSGGSVQHSSISLPYEWSVITGAAELALGDEITGFEIMPGGILAIWCRNSTKLLYGTSVSDWELTDHSLYSGAIEWTIQRLGDGIYLDDRGLTTLSAVQDYGDFAANVISRDIQTFLDSNRGYEQASTIVRKKNQYRLFFNNGDALCMTIEDGKVVGFTRLYFPDTVMCCCSAEDSSGNEEIFFGSDDGYVYQMDKGTSNDDDEIEAYLRLHFNHVKSPTQKKRFRKLTLEMDATTAFSLYVQPEFSYGDDPGGVQTEYDIASVGGQWDISTWDAFVWDGPFVSTAEARIDGSGTSISLFFYSSGMYDNPHTLQGVVMHYDKRGIKR